MSTFLDICSDVRAQAGIQGSGPTSVTGQTSIYADVVRWVKEAYNEIQTLHENWNFLYTEVMDVLPEGDDTFPALAVNTLRQIARDSFLSQFQGGDKVKIDFVPFHTFKNDRRYLVAQTGRPVVVTEKPNGILQFYPTADEDYNIYYEGFSRPDIMVENLDEPIFNVQYHDLIKLKALMKYGEFYNSQEVYQSTKANFDLLIRTMKFSELPKNNLLTPTLVRFA